MKLRSGAANHSRAGRRYRRRSARGSKRSPIAAVRKTLSANTPTASARRSAWTFGWNRG